MYPVLVATTIIQALIRSDPDLVTMLTDQNTGKLKVVLEDTPAEFSLPYVLVSYIYGGQDNKSSTKAFDMNMRVIVVGSNTSITSMIANKIDQVLANTKAIGHVPDGWNMWEKIRNVNYHVSHQIIKQVKFPSVGGYYRFRLIDCN